MSKRDKGASLAQTAAKQTSEQAETNETQPEAPDTALSEASFAAAEESASREPGQDPPGALPAVRIAELEQQLAQTSAALATAADQLRARDQRIADVEHGLARASEALADAAAQLRARDERVAELEQQLNTRATASPSPAGSSTPARPDVAALRAAWKAGKRVEVTYLGTDHYALIAGLNVDGTPRVFKLATVFDCGQSHVRALAEDPTISVRIVD